MEPRRCPLCQLDHLFGRNFSPKKPIEEIVGNRHE
jgi:hypothetical protein